MWLSGLSVAVGTCNAFLFVRHDFRGKGLLYILMLLPLIIPGVILGISILVFASPVSNTLEDATGLWFDCLRPGLILVILGQFSFITTFATLVISPQLKKFDTSLEEVALNLGTTRWDAVRQITLPFLLPAITSAGVVAVLMSFENFNTTLMLVWPDSPLTITIFDKLKHGSANVRNKYALRWRNRGSVPRYAGSLRAAKSMTRVFYVVLDVSLKMTSNCNVDAEGDMVLEAKAD